MKRAKTMSKGTKLVEQNRQYYYQQVAKLDVGGRIFTTRFATLCAVPGSLLYKLFEYSSNFPPPPEILLGLGISYGEFVIDRDPVVFDLVLGYLRNGGKLPRTFGNDYEDITTIEFLRADAEFYELEDLKNRCEAYLTQMASENNLRWNGVVRRFDI